MNRTVYIHFGAHKTGTTTLQADLASNRSNLEAAGLIYPNYNNVDSHYQWAQLLAGEKQRINDRQYLDVASEWLSSLQPQQSLLLSAESFYRHVNTQPDYLSKLQSIFKSEAITPVLCLRSQADYAKSLYCEWVTNWQYPHDIYHFINDFYSWFDFEGFIAKIGSLGKPILISYHEISGENLSTNFVQQLGFNAQLTVAPERLRVTQSEAEVYLKRLLNKVYPEVKFKKIVLQAIKQVLLERYTELQTNASGLIWHGILDPVTFERSFKCANLRICEQFNLNSKSFFPETQPVKVSTLSNLQFNLLAQAYNDIKHYIDTRV